MGIVRIGTNPIAWSNDDMPELGGDTPLETCLREARSIGFVGIEMGNKFPKEPAALKREMDAHGLTFISGWYGASLRTRSLEQEIDVLEPHLRLLAAMGCKVMVFCEVSGTVQNQRKVPLAERPVLREDEWRPFLDKLVGVAEHINARGIQLAYHHHMGTIIEKAHEVDRLLAETPPVVSLLFDTGHVTFAGDDPSAVARKWAERIVHVHAKDVRPDVMERARAERWSFLDSVVQGVFSVPGDGCVDFRAALRPIAEADYGGWLVVEAEQDPRHANPLTYGKIGYDNLHAIATEVGFTVHN
jgi:inosose dehydratase